MMFWKDLFSSHVLHGLKERGNSRKAGAGWHSLSEDDKDLH